MEDPKSAVNQFIQRFIRRPVNKDDIVYATAKYPAGLQSTVKLNCLQGEEIAGALGATLKDAERFAASQVLEFFKEEIANLEAAVPSSKQSKASSRAQKRPAESPAEPADEQLFHEFGADAALLGVAGSDEFNEQLAKCSRTDLQIADGLDPLAAALLAENSKQGKADLNTFCSKVMRRIMEKGEVAYETTKVQGGFQATVRCEGLPPPFGDAVWAGEVFNKKVDAEQSAAGIALAALTADPDLVAAYSAPTKPKIFPGCGKGKGMGFGKGFGKNFGKGFQNEWGGGCKGGFSPAFGGCNGKGFY